MADEKKPKKIISAATGEEVTNKSAEKRAAAGSAAAAENAAAAEAGKKAPKQRASGFRLIAVLLWLLAIGAEVVAVLILNKTIYAKDITTGLIIALAADLILVVLGSQLWKRANRIDPASEKNKLKFWLWNNMGVIVSAIAFVPIIILMLKDKDLDPQAKKIASIVGIAALLIAGASSYTWNPVSQEALTEATDQVTSVNEDGGVYWTRFGRKYHLDTDCSSLSRSETLFSGSIDEAFEANRTDLCKFCAKAHGIDADSPSNAIDIPVAQVDPPADADAAA